MQNTQNKFKVAAGIATFSGLLVFSVFISKPGLVDPNSVKANITGFDNVTISASDNDHTVGGITGADFTCRTSAFLIFDGIVVAAGFFLLPLLIPPNMFEVS